MLATVQFDDQPNLTAEEVNDVRTEGNLAAKLGTSELPVPQRAPKNALDVGLIA